MRALWVHAIIPTSDVLGFEVDGDAGGAVYTVPCGQLAAVVQPTDCLHVDAMDSGARHAHEITHRTVLATMAEAYPLLPVAFGTVLANEEAVQRMLRFGKDAFEQLLADLVGLVEVELLLHRTAPPGGEPYTGAPGIVRRLRALLDQQQGVLVQALDASLRTLALATESLPADDDDGVARYALLLRAEGRQRLDALLAEMASYADEQWRLECREPAPPARFASVGIDVVPPARVLEARRLLGVTPEATPADLQHAYEHRVAELLAEPSASAEARHARLAGSMRILIAAAAQAPPADAAVLLLDLPTLDVPHTFPVTSLS